jgi:hypothetical protein
MLPDEDWKQLVGFTKRETELTPPEKNTDKNSQS